MVFTEIKILIIKKHTVYAYSNKLMKEQLQFCIRQPRFRKFCKCQYHSFLQSWKNRPLLGIFLLFLYKWTRSVTVYLPKAKSYDLQTVPEVIVFIFWFWVKAKPQHEQVIWQETDEEHWKSKTCHWYIHFMSLKFVILRL